MIKRDNYCHNFISKSFQIKIIFVFLFLLAIIFGSCENKPTDLGLNYVPPYDTLKTKILDSRKDSVQITGFNFRQYVNTGNSQNLLVGKYQGYESRGLLKFNFVPTGFDSATVISAKLCLRYNKYYFQDSLGVTSFNIYKLNKSVDFSTVTFDQVSLSDIGTSVLANFSGTPTDTNLITLNFDNQTISDWLKYAVDTSYINKNYGIVFLPGTSSTTIKGFYSAINQTFYPYIKIVTSKNTTIDSFTITGTVSASLSDAPSTIIPNGEIVLQSGVSYHGVLKFDLTKLPANVIINEAYIELKTDKANSFYPNSDSRVTVSMLTDTTMLTSDNVYYYGNFIDSITYSVRINPIMQFWNISPAKNYGVQLKTVNDLSNLDKIVLYSPIYSDVSKRPYLRILYTLRN